MQKTLFDLIRFGLISIFNILYLILNIFFTSCNPEKVDTRGVKEEMEKFKIKKISQAEILGQAEKDGSEIFELFQVKTVTRKLDSALSAGLFENALPYCVYSNFQEKKTIEKMYEASFSKAGFTQRLRNSSNQGDTLQKQILDAYIYNIEQGLPLTGDVQMMEDVILYNKPIILDQESCLKCHGNPEKEIGMENYKKILKLYPNDKSVNFKKGELIGVFTVRLNKEAVVRRVK
jgi:hypothetical protein